MKIASIGTSEIVEHFLSACQKIEQIEVAAIYSRTFESAKKLSTVFGTKNIFVDLDEMLKQTYIDTVYIASPNSLHYSQALQCIKAKKNVIIEKPICSNSSEITELFETAAENGVFVFEAMSLRFLPNLELLKKNISRIGKIKWIETSCINYSRKFDALQSGEIPNVFSLEYSGGALMDLNIYNINFVYELLGIPLTSEYLYQKHTNGIDLSGIFIMKYEDVYATCVAAKDCYGKPFAYIHGQEGHIEIAQGTNGLRGFTLISKGNTEVFNAQNDLNHFIYEIREFCRIVTDNDIATQTALNTKSRDIMTILTQARYKAGLIFKDDQEFILE